MTEERSKKRKAEEDAIQKAKLVKILAERDESIEVLRNLAAEKEHKVKQVKGPEEASEPSPASTQADGDAARPPSQGSVVKPTVDYTGMTLERLKVLEKARDATLSFLLKRIDKAEAELAVVKDKVP